MAGLPASTSLFVNRKGLEGEGRVCGRVGLPTHLIFSLFETPHRFLRPVWARVEVESSSLSEGAGTQCKTNRVTQKELNIALLKIDFVLAQLAESIR
ncbi:hypothetical protein RRG08_066534 [Elysia crispata]|uniref:Uncharacterized protein n=1 Tax=Elysia crispata TaxID=231223 RepID=A0AAE0ZN15_9GAST|nr:hypothetical protein RRG08_066534 [Elysia crispata]